MACKRSAVRSRLAPPNFLPSDTTMISQSKETGGFSGLGDIALGQVASTLALPALSRLSPGLGLRRAISVSTNFARRV